jgi:hypothetical protein
VVVPPLTRCVEWPFPPSRNGAAVIALTLADSKLAMVL